MKFAHLADAHIGSWRDPKLRDLSLKAFEKSVEHCIENKMDFILISGDLFNTSLPAIDKLKSVVIKLRELKEKNIPVYIIAGSHDFSPSGKTILDVLEEAQLLINVVKGNVIDNKLYLNFTIDKTGAKITGVFGKKGMLERRYYEALNLEPLENETGFKIFMFHTALSELKPKELEKMQSYPVSFLPKNFDYYAGGHVHIIRKENIDGKNIIYPGPLFPNNFRELEDLQGGGFYIYDNGSINYEPIQIVNVHSIKINCNHKNPKQIEEEIDSNITNKEFNDTIVTIRLQGVLESGKISDINFKEVFNKLYNKSAYFVMKSTYLLQQKEFEEIKIEKLSSEEIEDKLINEHLGQIKMFELEKERELTKKIIESLSIEKEEGETNRDFERRIKDSLMNILELKEI